MITRLRNHNCLSVSRVMTTNMTNDTDALRDIAEKWKPVNRNGDCPQPQQPLLSNRPRFRVVQDFNSEFKREPPEAAPSTFYRHPVRLGVIRSWFYVLR
jgi:hypothetical protein